MPHPAEPNAHIKLVEAATWKAAGDAERGTLGIVKSTACDPEIVKAQEGEPDTERAIDWVVSTEDVDRDRDILRVSGWDLKAFKKNPVILWAHNYQAPPIGKAVDIQVDREKLQLRMRKQFATKEQYPFADTIYELAKAKYLRTASVGFIAKDYEENAEAEPDRWGRRGMIIKKQELLESSVVPVPSNPMALAGAKAAHGIDLEPLADWCVKFLDGEKGDYLFVPRKSVEEIIAVVRPAKPTIVVPAQLELPEAKAARVVVPPVAGDPPAAVVVSIATSSNPDPADPASSATAHGSNPKAATKTTPVSDPASADGAPASDAGVKAPSAGPVSPPEPTVTETAAEATVLLKRLELAMVALRASVDQAKAAVAALEKAHPDLKAVIGGPEDPDLFAIEDEDTYELSDDDARAAEPDNHDLFEVDPELLKGALREVIGAR